MGQSESGALNRQTGLTQGLAHPWWWMPTWMATMAEFSRPGDKDGACDGWPSDSYGRAGTAVMEILNRFAGLPWITGCQPTSWRDKSRA